MKDQTIIRDERTITVENSSYRWGYLLLSFGLLVVVACRSFIWRQSSWDLLALVVLSGVVTTLYQWTHNVLTRHWLIVTIVAALLAAVVAVVSALLR
jgi:uncharacterized protein DUF6442